jgi:hypothetical protein
MQHKLPIHSSQPQPCDDILTISFEVFRALHPMEQFMAQALERVGKVRIEKDTTKAR